VQLASQKVHLGLARNGMEYHRFGREVNRHTALVAGRQGAGELLELGPVVFAAAFLE
jgi:hypothetical protein